MISKVSHIVVIRLKNKYQSSKKKKLFPHSSYRIWDLYAYSGQNMKCSIQHRTLEVWTSDMVAKFHSELRVVTL